MRNLPVASNGMVKRISKLKQKKHRSDEGLFVAEGCKCVSDLAAYLNMQFAITSDSDSIMDFGCPMYGATQAQMKKMSSMSTPPTLIGVFDMPSYSIDCNLIKEGLTLVADGVQDPGNLGTMIRIADWYGVKQMLCSPDCADVWSAKTVQATMGSLARVRVISCDLSKILGEYRGIEVCGLMLEGENIYERQLPKVAFVVMGSEGHGISPSLRKLVTNKLLLPSFPPGAPTGESLNVGVATAVTLSEFRRREFK